MNSGELTIKVKNFAKAEGADLVGIASADAFSDVKQGTKPTDLLPSAQCVVTFGIKMLTGVTQLSKSGEVLHPRAYYMHLVALSEECLRMSYRIARFIEGNGYRAVMLSTGLPMEMSTERPGLVGDLHFVRAAVEAGLGARGKNLCLITEKFGPRVRIGCVVTEAPLVADKIFERDLCGNCRKCIDACPVEAIGDGWELDKGKCIRFHQPYGLARMVRFLTSEIIGKSDEEKVATIRSPVFWNLYQYMVQTTLGLGVGGGFCGKCIKGCPVGSDKWVKDNEMV